MCDVTGAPTQRATARALSFLGSFFFFFFPLLFLLLFLGACSSVLVICGGVGSKFRRQGTARLTVNSTVCPSGNPGKPATLG